MKKRITSMLLALIILIGAFAVSFESEAAGKAEKYTKIVLSNNKTTDFTFTVTEKNKGKASVELNTLFSRMLPKKIALNAKINDKKAKITTNGKTVYIEFTESGKKKSLKKFLDSSARKKHVVTITFNANVKKVVKALSFSKGGKYTYGVKIGQVPIKTFKIKKGNIYFKAYTKERTGYIKNGVIYVKGDIVKSKFVKKLKKQGTVKSAKLVKIAK